MAKFSVIVVAAGSGERFGGKENKIFAKVDGQPCFLRALQLFVNRDDVNETLLVVAPNDIDHMKSKFGANIGFMGVKLVEGGHQRHESVARGLAAVADDAEFVAVHDAVRVCVAESWIDDIFQAAAKNGSAVPVVPITATIKRVDKNIVGDTVPRDGLYLSQTPQAFRKDILEKAYANLPDGDAITDDAQLVTAAGEKAHAVKGDARNIKITTPDDLKLAGAIVKILPQKSKAKLGAFDEAQW